MAKPSKFNEGDIRTTKDGHTITLIKKRAYKDIDVQFEDGAIVTGTACNAFDKGNIMHPDKKAKRQIKKKRRSAISKIGETTISKTGHKMEIVDGIYQDDITIRFDDGTIVEHKDYTNFKRGNIGYPKKHKGKTATASNGMQIKTIDSKEYMDTTVEFEDGSVINHVKTSHFQTGLVKHPLYPSNTTAKINIGCIEITNHAYRTNLDNYICKCNICGHRDIYNWKEIHAHNALHGIPAEQLTYQYIFGRQPETRCKNNNIRHT